MLKKSYTVLAVNALLLASQACQTDLEKIVNTNQPSVDVLSSEVAIVQLAKGGVYQNGFANLYSSVDDGLGGNFLANGYGMHEAMGDVIYIPWGNFSFKFADNPTSITLEDGKVVNMPIGTTQPNELRTRNSRGYGASNTMLLEWTYMYFLNNATNVILDKVSTTTFTGDADTKRKTLQAWAYWWKGYAYSRIGSLYAAGIVTDKPNETNSKFLSNVQVVAEGSKNFDKAADILKNLKVGGAYTDVMTALIPGFVQNGKGVVPSPEAWIRSINTYKARNILANKRVKDMTAADWQSISDLTKAGIQSGDPVFLMKTYTDNNKSAIDKDYGWVGAYSATDGGQTFYISERLIQDFRPGDRRLAQNFDLLESPEVNRRGRGLGFGTRWQLLDGGAGLANVNTFVHLADYGKDDIYLAGSYEENQLMQAEALIRGGKVSDGVKLIDAVRTYQGAGLAPLLSSLTVDKAAEEIRSERRIALFLRGLAFYDARRLGIIDDVSKGGGRKNAVVVVPASFSKSGKVEFQTKTTINYNYLSYFDVPGNEIEFNEPSAGSAPIKLD
ncbi:hypothetical protein J2I47_02130 [Fibrella sp. HMF5335]|uniref:RagB/SusD domain-containing protein n=1 Tax=Fibrella rubiginis TaxID=2817060 RepID=A0A939GA94_9BACT|nr:RagB/SusD family nutrient uptake outer membrane protein [Fibrella rubiginis]MBO0935337.1 hypothetical protein [Fibrella rubiginis]